MPSYSSYRVQLARHDQPRPAACRAKFAKDLADELAENLTRWHERPKAQSPPPEP